MESFGQPPTLHMACPACGHEATYFLVPARAEPRAEARSDPIGQQLRVLREIKGMGQREMARRIGISQSRLWRIEVGKWLPTDAVVTAWTEAAGAPEHTEQLLEALADAVRNRPRGDRR